MTMELPRSPRKKLLEEDAELHEDRLVEAELGVDARDGLVGRPIAQHRARGIARQQAHEHEHHHHDQEEGRDDLQQPEDDVPETDRHRQRSSRTKERGAASKLPNAAPGFNPALDRRLVYFSTEAPTKMLLPSGICTKPFTVLRNATG